MRRVGNHLHRESRSGISEGCSVCAVLTGATHASSKRTGCLLQVVDQVSATDLHAVLVHLEDADLISGAIPILHGAHLWGAEKVLASCRAGAAAPQSIGPCSFFCSPVGSKHLSPGARAAAAHPPCRQPRPQCAPGHGAQPSPRSAQGGCGSGKQMSHSAAVPIPGILHDSLAAAAAISTPTMFLPL